MAPPSKVVVYYCYAFALTLFFRCAQCDYGLHTVILHTFEHLDLLAVCKYINNISKNFTTQSQRYIICNTIRGVTVRYTVH